MKNIFRTTIVVFLFLFSVAAVSAATVTVSPAEPLTDDNLFCLVDGQNSNAYNYKWTRAGVNMDAIDAQPLSSSYTSAGETWMCVVSITYNAGYGDQTTVIDSATVTIQGSLDIPEAGDVAISIAPEVAYGGDDLTCLVDGQNSDSYTYLWSTSRFSTDLIEQNPVSASHTLPGDTWACSVVISYDVGFGEQSADLGSASTTIQDTDTTPSVSVTATPTEGTSPVDVDFTCDVTDGNGWLVYDWSFGDGSTTQRPNPTHTYNNAGTYTATCTVTDQDGDSGSDSVTVVVDATGDVPVAVITPAVQIVEVGATASFDGSGSNDPDGGAIVSFDWTFGDGSTGTGATTSHAYGTPGDFSVELTVTDDEGAQASAFATVRVTETPSDLSITDLTCFDTVVEGQPQSCSVSVEQDGSDVGGALVDLYYNNGAHLASCTTDALSGACEAQFNTGTPGTYTVYATASKDGVADTDGMPEFTFDVLGEADFGIHDLRIFNEQTFTVEDYDFFRGERMFVSFALKFADGTPLPADALTNVELVSPPGGRATLNEFVPAVDGVFKFWLDIPTTHAFKGESQVFTFVFDFADGVGKERMASLTIRNNPPVIADDLAEVFNKVFDTPVVIDLSPYASDVEDRLEDLRWVVSGFDDSVVDVNVDNAGQLTITPVSDGRTTLKLELFDLDADADTLEVSVATTDEVANAAPNAIMYVNVLEGESPLLFMADGSNSFDPDGAIVGHVWVVRDSNGDIMYEDLGEGMPGELVWVFGEGVYTVSLTVLDNDQASDIVTVTVVVDDELPETQCSDLADNDGDGLVDMADPDCEAPTDEVEAPRPECSDGWDNDGDGFTDIYDKDCSSRDGTSETSTVEPAPSVIIKGRLTVSRIKISTSDTYEDDFVYLGEPAHVAVALHNEIGYDLEDVSVRVAIDELGVYNSKRLDELEDGDSATVHSMLDIPFDAAPGIYDLRIVVSNDDVRRVKYREVELV